MAYLILTLIGPYYFARVYHMPEWSAKEKYECRNNSNVIWKQL